MCRETGLHDHDHGGTVPHRCRGGKQIHVGARHAAQQCRIAPRHAGIVPFTGRLEHRPRRVAQGGVRRPFRRLEIRRHLLQQRREPPRIHGRTGHVARLQAREHGVVRREEPLGARGDVVQHVVVHEQRQRTARGALRVPRLGELVGTGEGDGARIPLAGVEGHLAAMERLQDRVVRRAVGARCGAGQRLVEGPHHQRATHQLLTPGQPARSRRPRNRGAAPERGAAARQHRQERQRDEQSPASERRHGRHGAAGCAQRLWRSSTTMRCCASAIASASFAFCVPTASMRCSSSESRNFW